MCINKDDLIIDPQELYNLFVKEKYGKDFKKFVDYLKDNCPLLFGKGLSKIENDPTNYMYSQKLWIEFPKYESIFLDPSKPLHLQTKYENFLRKFGWKVSYSDSPSDPDPESKEFNNANDRGLPYIRICIKPIKKLNTIEKKA